jgi:hypothetical protein
MSSVDSSVWRRAPIAEHFPGGRRAMIDATLKPARGKLPSNVVCLETS